MHPITMPLYAPLFPKLPKKIISVLFACSLMHGTTFTQVVDTTKFYELQEVTVKAYGNNRRLKDVPAAVNYLGGSALDRFGSASIVQAVNTMPGARMEERSPGSYRFNIRGSSLRSPFGVRNVKVYFNDIPITDPGGVTYLNQLGSYNFRSVEILKGPANSIYGAGTGGVLLIESLATPPTEQAGTGINNAPGSPENSTPLLFAEYSGGSYNLQNIYGSVQTGSSNTDSRLGFQHQQSNGYRSHSKLKRDVFSWNGLFRFGEQRELKTTFLFGNLFYETPGALTKAEYAANPRASRPGTGVIPGAESANASISQKQFIAGASYTQQVLPELRNTSTLYGMFTELRNPAIANYGHNREPHVGGRSTFELSKPVGMGILNVDVGAELQQGFATASIHKNVNGRADTLRSYDEIDNSQSFIFTQAVLDLQGWTITAGASLNFLKVQFERFSPGSAGRQTKRFNNQVAPRLAILKKFGRVNLYASVAKGFSPPSTAELVPTGGAVNLDLSTEQGVNYDIGIKSTFFKKLYAEVNAFSFSLNNTIVQRRNAAGTDFYLNAGKTEQHGIETYINYPLFAGKGFIEKSMAWVSHTWHDFHYKTFKQLTNDYSGNRMPGEAPNTVSAGIDLHAANGLLATMSYYFSDKVSLNDAGLEYAHSYHLVAVKIGYQKSVNKVRLRFTAGVDNLLDQNYSLGNDINGFGGRFFNIAPGRNYYTSLSVELQSKNRIRK